MAARISEGDVRSAEACASKHRQGSTTSTKNICEEACVKEIGADPFMSEIREKPKETGIC